MHRLAGTPFGLYLVALILPDVLFMARGDLLAWVSTTLRVAISVLLLLVGWYFYRALARIGGALWGRNFWESNSALGPLGRKLRMEKLAMPE
jgi:hypothetical protein